MYRIIVGNSMKPTYPLISLNRFVKQDRYFVGDVVAFKAKNGSRYCHRIIKINNFFFTTKGDNRSVSKECEIDVPIKNIEGKIV